MLAEDLASNFLMMKDELVCLRRESLSVAEVAERCGCSEKRIKRFERYYSNPDLMMVQRYALAIHATIKITVRSCADTGRRTD